MPKSLLVMVAGFVVLLVTLVWAISTNRGATQRECVRQHQTVTLLRLYLEEGSRQFVQRPAGSRSAREIADFRRRVTILLNEADCKPE